MLRYWLLLPTLAALASATLCLRRRHSQVPRCPTCRYDMRGGTLTCPECGHTAPTQDSLHVRPRRKKLAALFLLIALTLALFAAPRLPRTIYYALAPTWKTVDHVWGTDFDVRVLERTDPELFGRAVEIRNTSGQLVFHLDGNYFTIGNQRNTDPNSLGIGRDMTGEGVPDLLITEDTGGSGCQQTHYIFQLGAIAPLAVIDSCGYFEDKDGDKVPEFIASDRTFAYRWTSGAGSPHPEVILRWHKQQHRYVVAADLMLKAPDQTQLTQARSECQRFAGLMRAGKYDGSTDEPRALSLQTALNLIYSGNRDQGLTFLRETWPDRANLDTFMVDFEKALNESPYAAEVRDLSRQP